MTAQERGRCPVCGADVAVTPSGTVVAHGRTYRRAEDGSYVVPYGCRGWGQPAA